MQRRKRSGSYKNVLARGLQWWLDAIRYYNRLTGSEIKRNYANCGEFHVSKWIQEGWFENKSELKNSVILLRI